MTTVFRTTSGGSLKVTVSSAWRSEGDMIILVAAGARSITRAAVNITDYFSRRRIIKHKKLLESQVVNKIILPDMTVSGGIAGGKTFTPMVITRNGDISGDIINTAARLQSFANLLDPRKTRILMTNHVVYQLKKNQTRRKDDLLGAVSYFNLGRLQFKGMELNVYEILFRKSQKEQLAYQKTLLRLYSSPGEGAMAGPYLYIPGSWQLPRLSNGRVPLKLRGHTAASFLPDAGKR